jgi:hypothetical protein
MRGWTDIGSDVSWSDYGGKWAKRAKDGSFYVLRFNNMYEACGEEECKRDGQAQYVCEVMHVDVRIMPRERINQALQCCGYRILGFATTADQRRWDHVIIEACVSYGAYAPLDSLSGDHYPDRIRAAMRRSAETMMRDAKALNTALARPVNRIGSTAAEYARGDLDAALNRGPFDTGKNILRKLHGLPPIKSEEA